MPTGVAAQDEDLALALFRQGCFDVVNGEAILSQEREDCFAVALAQTQQGCEKVLKAWLVKMTGRRVYRRPSHLVWTEDLQAEALNTAPGRGAWADDFRSGDLRKVRESVKNVLGADLIATLTEIEGYAPFRSWEHPNTEYPWVDAHGVVQIPAKYFDDDVKIAGLSRDARRMVRAITKVVDNRDFRNEWIKIKAVSG